MTFKSFSSDSTPAWIWCADTDHYRHIWAWARRSFYLEKRLAHAPLRICADLRYTLWVNGNRAGFGPPKFHPATPTADSYDIAPLLQAGRNVIAVQVYSIGPEPISSCAPQRGALWLELLADGQHITSDATWKMCSDPGYDATGTASRSTQPPNERYDARLALPCPQSPDCDDSEWPFARILPEQTPLQLELRDIPHVASERYLPDRLLEYGICRFGRTLAECPLPELSEAIRSATYLPDRSDCIRCHPSSLPNTACEADTTELQADEAAYCIWDMGRIWSGYPVVQLDGTAGTVVDISYGEHLSHGHVNPAKARMHYVDRVILSGQPLEYRVTWPKSARYIQIHIHGGKAVVNSVQWERSTYPVVRKGSFSSTHATLDHAIEISLHTVQLCMEDSYMDTPWRERGSWLGDDLIKAQAAGDYFQDHALARRFLLHHARGQRANGMFCGKYPGNTTSEVSTWSLRFPPSLLEYCAQSGDWELAHELWPSLLRLLAWLDSLQTPCGLLQAPPVTVTEHTNRYNFIDWAPIDMRGINSAWNAFAYEALRCIRTIAEALGEADTATAIATRCDVLREAFRTHLWDNRRGIFANGLVDGELTSRWGCQENYLALLYRLADSTQTARIIDKLRSEDLYATFEVQTHNYDVELPGIGKVPTVALALSRYRWPAESMVPLGTPYFAGYMIDALCEAGMVAEAFDFILERWGNFLRQGATTVWETWNAEQSHSHGWSAIPAVFAARTLAGVRRADATASHWHILPETACLPTFRSRVATRWGIVQVEWHEGTLVVDVPTGGTFFAGLPTNDSAGTLYVNGEAATDILHLQRNATARKAVRLQAGRTTLQMLPPAQDLPQQLATPAASTVSATVAAS